jgi:UDP-2-acetamido-3-amino-2,3-dideoxy-glucuronate N-acetyltransferase
MPVSEGCRVHPTAIVEDGALVGVGTTVWHHAHIRDGASVGRDCVIGKNVYIDTHAIVGDRCKLQNNVCVYDGVTIGNDVFVGPSATFTNDLIPRAFNVDWQVVPTHVHDGASIGANATIVCGVTVGQYAMIAAGATVTGDVADHQLVAGTPARHHGWVCRCGKVVSRDALRPPPPLLLCEACAH